MEAMIDNEHVVDVAHRLGEAADDLDRLFNGGAFQHGRVLRLHQATRRVRGIAQELLDPCGQRPRQTLQDGLRAFLGDRAQYNRRIVGVQLLENLPQTVDRQLLDDCVAGDR